MILLLSISCFLSFSNCREKIAVTPILIGDARIAGTISEGALKWEPKENQLGKFYIVTPAFVKVCLGLAIENSELKKEIEKLIASQREK